jgi:hypothetical protein
LAFEKANPIICITRKPVRTTNQKPDLLLISSFDRKVKASIGQQHNLCADNKLIALPASQHQTKESRPFGRPIAINNFCTLLEQASA